MTAIGRCDELRLQVVLPSSLDEWTIRDTIQLVFEFKKLTMFHKDCHHFSS